MDTTTNAEPRQEPSMLPPQQRLGRPGVRQPSRKTPEQSGPKQSNRGIDRRLNLHSVHILALEAMIAAMPPHNGIDVERVYAYIDARASEGNSNLGAAAKKVAAKLIESTGGEGAQQSKMIKRAASWLVAVIAATAIVTAGFVGVAALVLKTGFNG